MMEGIMQSKSKTFFTFCFCFLLGIASGSLYDQKLPWVVCYFFTFVFVSFFIIYRKDKRARFFLYLFLFCTCGFLRYTFVLPSNLELPSEKIKLVGYVSAEPDIRQGDIRYIVKTDSHVIYLKSELYPRYEYGDVLEIQCQLKAAEPIGDFRYDMYVARLGVDALCLNPNITQREGSKGNSLMSTILSVKKSAAKRINQLWHEPYAGFMSGLLYGYRGGLGSLNEDFNRTGVTHIIAISGYNITIIATILLALCIHLYIPRQKAFWFVSAGILLFVFFTGASASVVRAGIMGFLVLLAQQLGRMNRMGNALIFTATAMTLHNPFILAWDAGFQLSFLATLGLVYIAPIIKNKIEHLPELFGIKESGIATISAIAATLPLMLYQFGRLSLVAPVVNILILWIIPWIMLAGFSSVLFSYLYLPFGKVLSWIAWIAMEYVLQVVQWFSQLPFASIEFSLPWYGVGMVYLILGIFTYSNSHRYSP